MSKVKKKKVLVATDAHFLASGYGVYAKEVLTRMHNSGKYEVAELACYITKDNPNIKNSPWKVYPNAVPNTDKRFEQYKSKKTNQFGAWRFHRVLLDFKPDIVVTWNDYWMYSFQETSPLRKFYHWVQMPMVDSAPQKIEWLYTYANADAIIPYTNWAKKVLNEACQDQINLFPNPANAGINPNEFYKISNKIPHKEKILGSNYEVIGTVMRNQRRKIFNDLLVSFKEYLNLLKKDNNLEKYNKSILYLHTSYPEEKGWNLPALLLEHELLDKVYFSYVCRKCNHYQASKFMGATAVCPKCNTYACAMPSTTNSVDTPTLNEIYNVFDFYVQYAIAEGFGMPVVEAASCGLPFASVDYSAMSEIADTLTGIKIPAQRMFRELETNADRAYPDNSFLVDMLYRFFTKMTDEQKEVWSNFIMDKCAKVYSWDNTYKVWDECLSQLSSNKLSWDNKELLTNHANFKVNGNTNNREIVRDICNNVINDPELFDTAVIQTLIKDLANNVVAQNDVIQIIDTKKAVDVLEGHLNNKLTCEQARLNPEKLTDEDYL